MNMVADDLAPISVVQSCYRKQSIVKASGRRMEVKRRRHDGGMILLDLGGNKAQKGSLRLDSVMSVR